MNYRKYWLIIILCHFRWKVIYVRSCFLNIGYIMVLGLFFLLILITFLLFRIWRVTKQDISLLSSYWFLREEMLWGSVLLLLGLPFIHLDHVVVQLDFYWNNVFLFYVWDHWRPLFHWDICLIFWLISHIFMKILL